MSEATPCHTTPIQHILGSSWIANWPEGLCQKILVRNNILRCLAGSSWGARTPTIRTSALAFVYSAAEYAPPPVWCRSCHSKKLDVALNDTQRLITGCLCPTPIGLLPILTGMHYQTCAGNSLYIDWDARPHSTINTLSTVLFQTFIAFNHSVWNRGALSTATLPS